MQWNFFKKRKRNQREYKLISLSLIISQRAPKIRESSNISHNSPLLSTIILHYDSILFQSLSVREVGFLLLPIKMEKGVSKHCFPFFPLQMPNYYSWVRIRNIGKLERKRKKFYRDAYESEGWGEEKGEEEREGGGNKSLC